MSLDLDDDQDFKIFDKDERILIYQGQWDDIVKLKDLNLCCQYMVNWTFWNFHGNKGDKLNKMARQKIIRILYMCTPLSVLHGNKTSRISLRKKGPT